jgi:hypothetical protein
MYAALRVCHFGLRQVIIAEYMCFLVIIAYGRSGKPEYTILVGSPVVCISMVLISWIADRCINAGSSISSFSQRQAVVDVLGTGAL